MTAVSMEELSAEQQRQEWLEGLETRFAGEDGLDKGAVCLTVLLDALKWRGSARHIIEVLPEGDFLDAERLRSGLAKLGFKTNELNVHPRDFSARLCPCLHVAQTGIVRVVFGRVDTHPELLPEFEEDRSDTLSDGLIVSDGDDPLERVVVSNLPKGKFFVIEVIPREKIKSGENTGDWLYERYTRFKSLFFETLGISFAINLLALVVPIAIMMIYDQVIAKESRETLFYVISGVGLAFFFEVALRLLRARAQAFAGARLDYVLGAKVFEQIIHLPASFTERAPVGGQITRIREFETFREFFTGALATVCLDLPFVVLFLAVIAWLGGPIVFVPIVLALLYIALGLFISGTLDKRIEDAGKARSERHAFLSEMTRWLRNIKQMSGDDTWEERSKRLSADAAWMSLRVSRAQSVAQNTSQTLVMVAGVATLSFGVVRVINEDMTMGGLIATMILVWRVLQPMQTLFGLANRINQLRQSFLQAKRLLEFAKEQQPGDAPSQRVMFNGDLSFNRVSMRYSANANPALLGVSFSVKEKEMIAIGGPSGAGKSTIASLAIGLLSPQAGTVTLDGIDIRQLRPITLRQTLAFVPQRNYAFPGTIFDNIALADPSAGIDQVRKACKEAGILPKIEALPDGFDTRFRGGSQSRIPQSFLQQLALARALLRDAPVIVMDEPASALDERDERMFIEALKNLRGTRTVLMVTQRPSHMRMCDRLVMFKDGQIDLMGPPDEVLGAMRQRSVSAAQSQTPAAVQGTAVAGTAASALNKT